MIKSNSDEQLTSVVITDTNNTLKQAREAFHKIMQMHKEINTTGISAETLEIFMCDNFYKYSKDKSVDIDGLEKAIIKKFNLKSSDILRSNIEKNCAIMQEILEEEMLEKITPIEESI